MGETKLAQNMRKYSEKMATPPWMKCSPSSKNLIRKTVCIPDIFKGKISNNSPRETDCHVIFRG